MSGGGDALCTPFRYVFSFRSKKLYLSFGCIWSSRGISAFHRSTALTPLSPFDGIGAAIASPLSELFPSVEAALAWFGLVDEPGFLEAWLAITFRKAVSTTATTWSTMRRRFRWRAFCGRERRQGIFLRRRGKRGWG